MVVAKQVLHDNIFCGLLVTSSENSCAAHKWTHLLQMLTQIRGSQITLLWNLYGHRLRHLL